jgi:hypothetical protein
MGPNGRLLRARQQPSKKILAILAAVAAVGGLLVATPSLVR